MTPADALLAEIIANPADDTPRLIYADWLEEHSESERAEFIRLSCEWWRLGCNCLTPVEAKTDFGILTANCRECRTCILGKRMNELWMPHVEDWAPPIFVDGDNCRWNPIWTRGFVSEVRLFCADWLLHGPQIVRAAPIERVTLSDKEPHEPLGDGGVFWGIGTTFHDAPWRISYELSHFLPMTYWTARPITRQIALDALSQACLAYARAANASSTATSSPQR